MPPKTRARRGVSKINVNEKSSCSKRGAGKETSEDSSTREPNPGTSKEATPDAENQGMTQIVFSIDSTMSMYDHHKTVKKAVATMIQKILDISPDTNIAVMAHGDHFDDYLTKKLEFTNDVTRLVNYVTGIKLAHGQGDDWLESQTECYPFVMYEIRELLSWKPGSRRHLVMIGDGEPHDEEYYQMASDVMNWGWDKPKWDEEAAKLKEEGITVHSVQCPGRGTADWFWTGIADVTGGTYRKLDQIHSVVTDLLLTELSGAAVPSCATESPRNNSKSKSSKTNKRKLNSDFNDSLSESDDDWLDTHKPMRRRATKKKR